MVGLKPPEVPPTATMKFISAGMAGCIADLCTFPLDTAKVRLQIQGEVRIPRTISSVEYRGVLGTLSTMVRTEGARSLYSGLAAGLQRQMSFASIRIGLYDSVKQLYTPKGAENTGMATRLLAGCTTGAVAVACAQPTDVVKVRFQASGALSERARRYSSTVDAYRTIAREEGICGLWRGTLPNIARNAIINCGELVTYDLLKDALLRAQLMTDNVPCHFVAAFGAGFCATVVASPVDVVKTRYMNASPGQYRNALSCLLALLTQEGPAGLYKGAASYPRSWGPCEGSSLEQGQPVRTSCRDSVVGPGAAQDGHLWSATVIPWEEGEPLPGLHSSGQEKSLNSSHLCQKLWCLSSQSQEASAPGLCAGGLLVLPTLWGKSEGCRVPVFLSAGIDCLGIAISDSPVLPVSAGKGQR